MLAVLSPAKTLDMSATDCTLQSKPAMQKTMDELLPVVQSLTAKDLKQKMSISDSIAKLNADRYKNFKSQETKQACLAFDGPAYRGLRAGDFSVAEQRTCQAKVRILSGLYGLLRPYDELRPYRLEMGTKMVTPRGKTLYDFWGDEIIEQLVKELGASGSRIIVNCASQEYWKAVRPATLPSGVRVISCDFPGPAVYAKKARGLMCRHIVKGNVSDVAGLKTFKGGDGDRYEFSAGKSNESKLVFVRVGGAKGAAKQAAKSPKETSTKKRPAAAAGGIALKKRRT